MSFMQSSENDLDLGSIPLFDQKMARGQLHVPEAN